jgi:hypothetical protein
MGTVAAGSLVVSCPSPLPASSSFSSLRCAGRRSPPAAVLRAHTPCMLARLHCSLFPSSHHRCIAVPAAAALHNLQRVGRQLVRRGGFFERLRKALEGAGDRVFWGLEVAGWLDGWLAAQRQRNGWAARLYLRGALGARGGRRACGGREACEGGRQMPGQGAARSALEATAKRRRGKSARKCAMSYNTGRRLRARAPRGAQQPARRSCSVPPFSLYSLRSAKKNTKCRQKAPQSCQGHSREALGCREGFAPFVLIVCGLCRVRAGQGEGRRGQAG